MDGSVCPNATDGKKLDCILDLDSQILHECHTVQFANALDSKGEYFTTEFLLMVLILQQPRTINQIIQMLSNTKAG